MTRTFGVALFISVAGIVGAQAAPAAISVVDGTGKAVPYAVINIGNGNVQVADDSGRVRVRMKTPDSIRVHARRIGYKPYDGWVSRSGASDYRVTLPSAPLELAEVTVEARTTPLARTGFYDRMDRVKRGAIVGEFITPEEIEARNSMTVSRLLEGRRSIRVGSLGPAGRSTVIVGRGGCSMTILVDKQIIQGTAQDFVREEAPQSLSGNRQRVGGADIMLDINALVDGRSVMAIEIYPSTANAPAELVPLGGRGSCGIVAIWTGPRY